MASTFRQVWRWLLPWNMAKPDDLADEGALVAHTLTTLFDVTLTRAREGLNARFPSRAGASANALTAGDRRLPRGRFETSASWVARLRAWRTPRTHRVRGNAFELLEQIRAYWGGIAVRVVANGVQHHITADGTYVKTPQVFDWDSSAPGYSAARWARAWIEIFPNPTLSPPVEEQPELGDAALWGGALGTPGYTLGQAGVTSADVLAMRNLFQQSAWHPEHVQMEWLIVSFGAFADGVANPSGNCQTWSQNSGGEQIAIRTLSRRFWSLDPNYNNRYSGSAASFAETSQDLSGGSYGPGDATNAAAWGAQPLPGGGTYVGNSASFPIDVLLLDDGSVPQ